LTNLLVRTKAEMAKSNPQRTAETPSVFQRLKEMAHHLKMETYALYLTYRDPRTPWYAKVWTLFVVAHTFSPIDLIPDFIPILGYLDDIIITPIGIWLALKMIPAEVMTEARERAQQFPIQNNGLGQVGMVVIIAIWLAAAVSICYLVYHFWKK
jgi:uncharacterized membrane protein YkvA (DUF1232 family)